MNKSREASREEVRAARAYENLHVPALFRQWAPRVAEAAKIRRGDKVLDVACGTGVLARETTARLDGDGSVTGLDPSPGMLAVAEELDPNIEWREGAAESLPFDDHSFDAVVSQFGLMFFEDRVKALREMRRVLAPGGRLAVAVWESLENSEAYPIEVALLERVAGTLAADALRAPFTLGNRKTLTDLFESAGISAEITTHRGTAQFPSIRIMVEADLRGWLPVMGVVLADDQIVEVLDEAERALHEYVTPEGNVKFCCPAHIVSGIRR